MPVFPPPPPVAFTRKAFSIGDGHQVTVNGRGTQGRQPFPQRPPPPSEVANNTSSNITTVRQHNQNVEVVNVPEASHFFVTNLATRQAILSKLHLNSLLAYIDHLEAYRAVGINRQKIATFNRQYYSLLVGQKDSSQLLASMNSQVGASLASIEAKLEACQLKRMMTGNDLEGLLNGSPDFLEGAGGNNLPRIQIGVGQDSGNSANEVEIVEVIDLTGFSGSEAEVSDSTTGKKEDQQQYSGGDANTTNANFLAFEKEEDKLVEELKMKLALLEQKFKDASVLEEPNKKDVLPSKPFSSPAKEELLIDFESVSKSPSDQLDTSFKLCLAGHSFPLPKVFNRLSQVEKNVILGPVPGTVRGQYLNLCWEAKLYEKLAQAKAVSNFSLEG